MPSPSAIVAALAFSGLPLVTQATCGGKDTPVQCKPKDSTSTTTFDWKTTDIQSFEQVSYDSTNTCNHPGRKAIWEAKSSAETPHGTDNYIDIDGSIDGQDYYICTVKSTSTFDRHLDAWACDCV